MRSEKELRSAVFDLESISVELEDICNLLIVHTESLEDDINPIIKGKNWPTEHLGARWPLHQSTMNIIQIRLNDVLKELNEAVSGCYESVGFNDATQS